MSNLNPPFRVVCVGDDTETFVNGRKVATDMFLKKGNYYTVYDVELDNDIIFYRLIENPGGIANNHYEEIWYDSILFRLLPPSYENISKELAGRAMEVGDGQDLKPVRKEVEV